MTIKALNHVDILLVEDSPADVMITREAFEEYRLVYTLHVVKDGVEAQAFLNQEGKYTSTGPGPTRAKFATQEWT